MIRLISPPCALVLLQIVTACAAQHPRVDAAGRPVTSYVYVVPDDVGDGWRTASLSDTGIDQEIIERLVVGILSREFENIHSVLLVKDGDLVLEEYFYGYQREQLHELHSVSKSVTSVLVGIAVDKGMIPDIERPVYAYFPDYKGTAWIDGEYDVNIKHLLTMSAAVSWDERSRSLDDSRNSIIAMLQSDDWIRYVLERKRAETPGQSYNYSGGLTVLLGEILHRASGLYADEFAEKHLFGPLDISRYHWGQHRDGTVNTQGGLSLTPRDLAKIGYMMLKGGLWNGRRIVSEKWVADSTRAHIATEPGGWGYGYQWFRIEADVCGRIIEAFAAIGRGGQYIVAAPAQDQLAVFTSQPYSNSQRLLLPLTLLKDFVLPAMMPSDACR